MREYCKGLVCRAEEGTLQRQLAHGEFCDYLMRWIEGSGSRQPLVRFVFLWIGFNAWASLVAPDASQSYHDAYLIHCVANDKQMQDRFVNLIRSAPVFSRRVGELIGLSPIIQVAWMRTHGIREWQDGDRRAFLKQIMAREPYVTVKDGQRVAMFAPQCALKHMEMNEDIPCDWPHVLHAIYQIRCNLFHGGKVHYHRSEQRFVPLAEAILEKMWGPEIGGMGNHRLVR